MPQTRPLTSVRGRVKFINIRNVYASSGKEIHLTLVRDDGSEVDYDFTQPFTSSFLDIKRGDTVQMLWNKDDSFHGIYNLRNGVTYAVGGCLLQTAVPVLLALLLLGFAWHVFVGRQVA